MDTKKYEELSFNEPECFEKWCDNHSEILNDIDDVFNKYKDTLNNTNLKYISTWLLEKDIFINSENKELPCNKEVLSRGRIIMVNPGVNGIGREQRYIHPYIVLGEYNETFIGVPITNMAYNKDTKKYYLRNYFEVELINPTYPKPFTEYRTRKPSIADIRNISGLDKRRIVETTLYTEKKFVPDTYLEAISKKIRNSIASSPKPKKTTVLSHKTVETEEV